MTDSNKYRSGFIAVVGRPNVGKSTLINALIGLPVAITSPKPETTRKAIRGILTTEDSQIVLVDTPGIHRPRTILGQRLNDIVDASLSDSDAVAFLLPADQQTGPGDRRILSRLRSRFARKDENGKWVWNKPLIGVVTKIDKLSRSELVSKMIEINEFAEFTEIVPVSAVKSDNVEEIRKVFASCLPEGPQLYPAETVSEESPSEQISELIRGALLDRLNDELPHSLAVVVDEIEYSETENGKNDEQRALIHVSLYVERRSQKPIILVRNAENLVYVKKKLRTAINRIMGMKSSLDMHVKVSKEWQSNPKALDRLGFI